MADKESPWKELIERDEGYDRRVWDEVARGEDTGGEGSESDNVKAIALGMKLKFGQEGLALMPQVEMIEGIAVLQAIYDAIDPAASLDDLRKLIPASDRTTQG